MFISYCHSPDLWGARRPYIIPFSGDNLNLHLNINFSALFRKANIYNMRCSFKLFNFASIEIKGRITTAILLFEKKITTLKIILSLLYKHKYSWYWAGCWVWCSDLFIYNSNWDCCHFLLSQSDSTLSLRFNFSPVLTSSDDNLTHNKKGIHTTHNHHHNRRLQGWNSISLLSLPWYLTVIRDNGRQFLAFLNKQDLHKCLTLKR